MIVIAALALVAGFTLLYAGVRGIHWHDPWQLLIAWLSGVSTTNAPKQP